MCEAYLFNTDTAPLGGVPDEGRLLGQSGAVAVAAVDLTVWVKKAEWAWTYRTWKSCACVCVRIYPADVLALWTRRKGLGANDSVPPDKRVLLVQLKPSLFGPDHRGGVREALHACLFIHLWQTRRTIKGCLQTKQLHFKQKWVIRNGYKICKTLGKKEPFQE